MSFDLNELKKIETLYNAKYWLNKCDQYQTNNNEKFAFYMFMYTYIAQAKINRWQDTIIAVHSKFFDITKKIFIQYEKLFGQNKSCDLKEVFPQEYENVYNSIYNDLISETERNIFKTYVNERWSKDFNP